MRTVKMGLALLVSAAAFAGLWIAGTMDLASDASAAESVAIEPEPGMIGAGARMEDPLELILPDEIAADEPRIAGGVQVPDLSGTTALRAFRRGRELGFVVDVRDEAGDRVPASERLYMRVLDEGQSPAPGTIAERGATVRIVARSPRRGFASGY